MPLGTFSCWPRLADQRISFCGAPTSVQHSLGGQQHQLKSKLFCSHFQNAQSCHFSVEVGIQSGEDKVELRISPNATVAWLWPTVVQLPAATSCDQLVEVFHLAAEAQKALPLKDFPNLCRDDQELSLDFERWWFDAQQDFSKGNLGTDLTLSIDFKKNMCLFSIATKGARFESCRESCLQVLVQRWIQHASVVTDSPDMRWPTLAQAWHQKWWAPESEHQEDHWSYRCLTSSIKSCDCTGLAKAKCFVSFWRLQCQCWPPNSPGSKRIICPLWNIPAESAAQDGFHMDLASDTTGFSRETSLSLGPVKLRENVGTNFVLRGSGSQPMGAVGLRPWHPQRGGLDL